MGKLIQTFTYPRNAFASSAEESAQKALEVIQRVERRTLHRTNGRYKDEAFNDARLFLAIVGGPLDDPHVTNVGVQFRTLFQHSDTAAWRWLLTRSMWLYSFPNDSQAHCNIVARNLEAQFNFFDMITRLTVHFSALPAPGNILYFDELMHTLDDDKNWTLRSEELFFEVLKSRQSVLEAHETRGAPEPHRHAQLLDDLEPRYHASRDYMNSVFRKGFGQSGLFQIVLSGGSPVGIRLDPASYSNPVLAERLRFVLDHPRIYQSQ